MQQLRTQNAHLDRVASEAKAEITEFIRVRKLLSSELGLGEENIPADVLEAFEPLTGYHGHSHELAEALHAHRIRCLRIARQFLSAARAGKISWLHPLNMQDPNALVGSATVHLSHLETYWGHPTMGW